MPVKHIERFDCSCTRCGHGWIATTKKLPKRCANPRCRSPYWNEVKHVPGTPAVIPNYRRKV